MNIKKLTEYGIAILEEKVSHEFSILIKSFSLVNLDGKIIANTFYKTDAERIKNRITSLGIDFITQNDDYKIIESTYNIKSDNDFNIIIEYLSIRFGDTFDI